MNKIIFVTTNNSKFRDFSERLQEAGSELEHQNIELKETQEPDGIAITKHKLEQAIKHFPKRKIIVEDRGFSVPELNGFPGPYVKLILKTIGTDGFLKLMEGKQDRTAKFISVLGYWNGENDEYFVDEEIGFIAQEKRGTNLRGWTELLHIYGHTLFPEKTLAELNDNEWNEYMKEIGKGDYLQKFTSKYKAIN